MLIAYKTEIKPTQEQIIKIKEYMKVCCWLANKYIKENISLYNMSGLINDKQLNYITAECFYNNISENTHYFWLKKYDVSMLQKTLLNAEKSFNNFLEGKCNAPRLKKVYEQDIKIYIGNNWFIERHRIKIGILGYIRLKEYGYLPVNEYIEGGFISLEGNKYYVTALIRENRIVNKCDAGEYRDKNKIDRYTLDKIQDDLKKLEKKIKREKRCLLRKYRLRSKIDTHGIEYNFSNIEKQRMKIKKLEHRLNLLKINYCRKIKC